MLFFLYGDDSYRSSIKLKQIKDKFIKEVDPSGYNVVNIENPDIESLSKEFTQTGFLAHKKLVIIKNILSQKISKEFADFLLENISKLQDDKEDNILVFYENISPNTKSNPLSGEKLRIWKSLSQIKYKWEFEKLPDFQLLNWIIEEFKNQGKIIDKKAAEDFLGLVGNDSFSLSSEIQKVSNYSSGEKISREEVRQIISPVVNENMFLFSEKLAEKKKPEAIKLLNEQMSLGITIQQLLSMIIRQYRILLQIKSAIEDGVSQNNLAKYLSLHPFVVKKSIGQVSLYSLYELEEIYRKLLELDIKMKSSKLKPKTILNLFFLSV
ncbi:MAG: DNA polymerase III subunit delta [Patescibacteria group bacterium]|nr:DNA polymerase III subunit delta [Patescibacteria group bacterium]